MSYQQRNMTPRGIVEPSSGQRSREWNPRGDIVTSDCHRCSLRRPTARHHCFKRQPLARSASPATVARRSGAGDMSARPRRRRRATPSTDAAAPRCTRVGLLPLRTLGCTTHHLAPSALCPAPSAHRTPVLVAEELHASGCRLIVSVTSAGQIFERATPPYFVLIERAWRDEGTSLHYLPPSEWSHLRPRAR